MKFRFTICAAAVGLAIFASGMRAQNQPPSSPSSSPTAPIPPISSGGGGYNRPPAAAARGVSEGYQPDSSDPAQAIPDTNTLSGAQLFGVGSVGHARNIFDPSLSVSEVGQTVTVAPGQSVLGGITVFNGAFDFDRTWDRYHLTAVYNGGGSFYRGPITLNDQYQNVSVSQQVQWERWRLLLHDDFTATPGAAFTGSGIGGPGLLAQTSSLLGGALNSIGQAFVPSETIETGNAMRYMNTVLGQAEYSLSRRSAFTFSGSYGILHFADAGYVSSRMFVTQAGYDYLLDPKNSIAILGGYGKIDYTGTVNSTTDYLAAFAYGRKITGRLALQIGGGPQEIQSTSSTKSFRLLIPSVNSSLTYDRRRSGVSLSYSRGLTSGSGVFLGAKSDTISGTAHYQFTRFWIGSANGGYAINEGLAPRGTPSARFDNWFVGGNLGRQIGRHARINFNYGFTRQNSPNTCPVVSCGAIGSQQTFGMSVNWHLRPTG